MSNNQALVIPEKLLFYLKVKRDIEQDPNEQYFRDCEDEYLELMKSEEEDF